MQDTLDQLKTRIQQELHQLRAAWESHGKEIRKRETLIAVLEGEEPQGGRPFSGDTKPGISGGRFAQTTIAEAAEILLRELGPLQNAKLAHLIEAGGYQRRKVPGRDLTDFAMSVNATLIDLPQFIKRGFGKSGRWDLRRKSDPPHKARR